MDASDDIVRGYNESAALTAKLSGIGIFGPMECCPEAFSAAARALLGPAGNFTLAGSVPYWWLGSAYQCLLGLSPSLRGDILEATTSRRKGGGVYFTPDCLVTYITESVLSGRADGAGAVRILDPSMGGGDFLCKAVELISERSGSVGSGECALRCRGRSRRTACMA